MNCPKCSNQITAAGKFCARCGHDFGDDLAERIEFYFSLREEFQTLNAVFQKNVADGMMKLYRRIEKYEEMLNSALADTLVPEVPNPVTAPVDPKPVPKQVQPVSIQELEAAKMTSEPKVEITPQPPIKEQPAPPRQQKPPEPERRPVPPAPVIARPREPRRSSSELEVQVGQKWLLIIGILTMVFGVGYFLKYSFDQGWVGPAGRVSLAYLWGIVFLVVGDRFRKKMERFGLYLIGGGIAVLYFSAFAAFQIYDLFGQTTSFSIMILITVLACFLAVRYDTKWLAVLALVGGFLTPVLLSTGQDNLIGLMTYVTILNLGLLAIAFHKKWDLLNYLGFLFTYLLYSAWFARHYQDSKFWPAIIFLNVFYLIYALVPFIYQVRKSAGAGNREIVLMGLNAVFAFGYGYAMIKGLYGVAWVGILTVLYASVFLAMATYLMRKGLQSLDVFAVLLAKAMLFLIITVPIIFSRHWITIFWSAQGLGLLWMAIRLKRTSLVTGAYALIGISVLKFLLYDYSILFHFSIARDFSIESGYTYLIAERLLTSGFVLAVLYTAARLCRRASLSVHWPGGADANLILIVMGIVLFITLNIEVSSFSHDYLTRIHFAVLSVLWMVFALWVVRTAVRMSSRPLAVAGYVLMGAAVWKFVLYDYLNVFLFNPDSGGFASYTDAAVERLAITAIVLGCFYLATILSGRAGFGLLGSGRDDSRYLFPALGVLLFIVLNVETSGFFHDYLPQARFAAISVLWTLYSVALMLQGFRKNSAALRRVSFGLFLVVLLKVFLFDMQNFSTPYRIISFIILGVVLVATSYLYYRYKDRIITVLSEQEKQE
jgi:uncharacterized membrane protein